MQPVNGEDNQANKDADNWLTSFMHSKHTASETADNRAAAEGIEWEASEYIHHDKGASWLIILSLVTVVAVSLTIWFGQWIFAALLVLMAVLLGYYGLRPPRTVRYRLSSQGLVIGRRQFQLSDFRSFGVMPEGAFYSIRLIPVKRFSPATVIYFGQDDGESIVDILSAHMPMEELHPDIIDVIMHKLRF